ncbi:phosphotransferase [Scytonema sp. NUACC26]|uniref:phosphotransferase n=1 Tax=Scytonema sp. NUACC26 TaxID=3140176 RepID=UPI0034DCB221
MSDKDLQYIQSLQFSDVKAANALMQDFLNAILPFKINEVTIRPLAVSLNSLNGFLLADDGRKLFFKTHVEPKSIINEYYNSTILAEAGYPVIQPIFSSNEWGKQLLIYEYVEYPSLFDTIRKLELDNQQNTDFIVSLQQKSDDEIWKIYLETLQPLTAEQHEKAPIHQLFSHRLTGGRFTSFYENTDIVLPGHTIHFSSLAKMNWIINGVEFKENIASLVEQAIEVLDPSQSETPSIVGHGDAHNGNVFVDRENSSLVYFDPAFAGRHSPFLDLAKPLFHNVFAIWMYFPHEIAKTLSISWEIQENTIIVKHNFAPSEVRLALLQSKIQRVLTPLVKELKSREWLNPYWKKYLKLALFCCPFLTMNLSDTQKFPPEITLLGLAMTVEMGSDIQGETKSSIDSELDESE